MARICPSCHKYVEVASAHNCIHCGASMRDAAAAPARGFWAENWPWIVGPIVVVAILVLVLLWFMGSEGDSGPVYKIF
ncbi:MAG: hypothetical protein FJ294_01145 [Planctomycetes bacterium]|nr:hypothetical protein [Planctomycetota bacterium]